MSKVDPTLLGTMAWGGYTPIVPANFYDDYNPLSEAIGTGPMKLTEYVQDDAIVMEAFPDYWNDGIPCISKLTLKTLTEEQTRVASLRSGEIDGGTFSADVVTTLEGDDSSRSSRAWSRRPMSSSSRPPRPMCHGAIPTCARRSARWSTAS